MKNLKEFLKDREKFCESRKNDDNKRKKEINVLINTSFSEETEIVTVSEFDNEKKILSGSMNTILKKMEKIF